MTQREHFLIESIRITAAMLRSTSRGVGLIADGTLPFPQVEAKRIQREIDETIQGMENSIELAKVAIRD